jgi:hypothetical protein
VSANAETRPQGQQQYWLAPGESFGPWTNADAIDFRHGSAWKIPDWSVFIITDCDQVSQPPTNLGAKPALSYLAPFMKAMKLPDPYAVKYLPDRRSQEDEFGGPILPPRKTCKCQG